MFGLIKRFLGLDTPPAPRYIVEVKKMGGEWECVAMSFPSHQAGVDYAKQNYSGAWQNNLVRVRVL